MGPVLDRSFSFLTAAGQGPVQTAEVPGGETARLVPFACSVYPPEIHSPASTIRYKHTEPDDLLRSVPGVGEQVSLTPMACLPELGTPDRRQIAALVGVAPFNRDSGTIRGKRTVWGGRARVRAVLYMGALVASRYNSVIRILYQSLLKASKARKVALVACVRKLPTIVNSMVNSGRHWDSQTTTP